jgi:hypothetical protein
MPHDLPFDSLQETAEAIAQGRNEKGCFIITKHHDGSYSFGTFGISSAEIRHGLNLGIYYSFIFEEMEHKGQEH